MTAYQIYKNNEEIWSGDISDEEMGGIMYGIMTGTQGSGRFSFCQDGVEFDRGTVA